MQYYVTIFPLKHGFSFPRSLAGSHVPASVSIHESKMEGFFNKYRLKLLEHSMVDIDTGCRLWQACLKKGPIPYGIIKAQYPDGHWTTLHAHRLQYIVLNEILDLPKALEVSHLCHQPRCIEITHLSLEPHDINASRMACYNRNMCFGHGDFPPCLLAR